MPCTSSRLGGVADSAAAGNLAEFEKLALETDYSELGDSGFAVPKSLTCRALMTYTFASPAARESPWGTLHPALDTLVVLVLRH